MDPVGPCQMRMSEKKVSIPHCVTMADPTAGWFETAKMPEKSADVSANALELKWLSGHPRPNVIVHHRGTKFMAEFKPPVQLDHDTTAKPMMARNPQANAKTD